MSATNKRARVNSTEEPVTEEPVRETPNAVPPNALGAQDTAGERVQIFQVDLYAAIDVLHPSVVAQILKASVARHPDTAAMVSNAYAHHLNNVHLAQEAARQRVINFSSLSREAWHILNDAAKGSGSRQFEASFGALEDMESIVKDILDQTCASPSYGTKKSALETLRKIGKSIVLGSDELGSQVRKNFGYSDVFTNAMLSIARSLTPEERISVGRSTDEKGSFTSKLDALSRDARGYCIFEGLEEVAIMFRDAGPVEAQVGGEDSEHGEDSEDTI